MNKRRHSHLPRLAREFYRGLAFVHWEHSLEGRATGWLDDSFHLQFRELLSHACARYGLITPCYTLMPDHSHLVWIGIAEDSDQLKATAFLRRHLAGMLGEAKLQDRPYDHVLREAQRQHDGFQRTCNYILGNPQRAELVGDWREWPYLGALFPGYPRLDPREECFWEDFWKLFNRTVDGFSPSPALPRRATVLESGFSGSVARPGRGGIIPALPRRATDQENKLTP